MSIFICRYSHYPPIHCIVFGLLIGGLFLPGCSALRPNQEVSKSSNTIQISEVVSSDLRFCQTVSNQWWTVFNDPLLSSFISRAEQNSVDTKIILERLKESRSLQTVDAPAATVRGNEIKSGNTPAMVKRVTSTIPADASWEVDLLDRLLGSIETATADHPASWEDYINLLITVRAEVASVYLQIRTQQARLNTAANTIALLESFVKLTTAQYQNGLTGYFDAAQAKHVLALAETEVPVLRMGLEQSIARLGILLGESSDDLQKNLHPVCLISLPSPSLVADIPADRLRQRPDIRTAERKLVTWITRDNNATEDRYPSLSLTGKIEALPLNTVNNPDSDSPLAEFGSLFRWDIFNMDRSGEQFKGKDDKAALAFDAYKLRLRKARKEVADRLTGYHEQYDRFEMLDQSVQALKEKLGRSTQLYTNGLISFQNLLDVQESLFAVENGLDVARGRICIQLVGLYKALAGGWRNFDQDDKHSNSENRKIVELFAPFTLDGKRESGV